MKKPTIPLNIKRSIDRNPALKAYIHDLHRQVDAEKVNSRHLYGLAFTDPLTQLYNRRYLDDALRAQFRTAREIGQGLTVMMLDLDNFKDYNDTYRHQEGDKLLEQFGSLLKESVREDDLPCRYGGEEFCVVMPCTDLPAGYVVAERIRMRTASMHDDYGGVQRPITVSIGLGTYPGPGIHGPESLLLKADSNLYEAKNSGRNLIVPGPDVVKGYLEQPEPAK